MTPAHLSSGTGNRARRERPLDHQHDHRNERIRMSVTTISRVLSAMIASDDD
jgi:hypothetical protein